MKLSQVPQSRNRSSWSGWMSLLDEIIGSKTFIEWIIPLVFFLKKSFKVFPIIMTNTMFNFLIAPFTEQVESYLYRSQIPKQTLGILPKTSRSTICRSLQTHCQKQKIIQWNIWAEDKFIRWYLGRLEKVKNIRRV